MASTNEGIAQRLIELRNRTGKTQSTVAHESGVGFRSLQDYERARTRPTAGRIALLARYYRTTPEYVLSGDDNNAPIGRLARVEATTEELVEVVGAMAGRLNELLAWVDQARVSPKPPPGTLAPIQLPDALLRDLEAEPRTTRTRRRSG